jgi:hypothetical protein
MENMELRKFLEFGTKSVCSPPVSFFLHCTAISQLDGHNNMGIHMLRSNLLCFGSLLVGNFGYSMLVYSFAVLMLI